jgi:hypothetical protein
MTEHANNVVACRHGGDPPSATLGKAILNAGFKNSFLIPAQFVAERRLNRIEVLFSSSTTSLKQSLHLPFDALPLIFVASADATPAAV